MPEVAETTLEMRRTFAAPREDVFRAWTNREQFNQWFAPSDQMEVVIYEFDVRPGGRYRLDLKAPGGDVYSLAGEYREIREPDRLVFTWAWLEGVQTDESLVTIEFFEKDSGTDMLLTHSRLSGAESRDQHVHGWTPCLDRLEKYLEGEKEK
jgi:uncharacterized protein YndB with AHSA1/START domain